MLVRTSHTNPDTKVIIIGDPEVGKTSIVNQFDQRKFNGRTENTVGAAFITRAVETTHGPVNLLIWDTAGQERYRSLIPMYSRNAAAALLVVDASNVHSYEHLEEWYTLLKESCACACKIYVVANKMDLECRIPLDQLKRWAQKRGHDLFMTCASDYETIEPVFRKVAEDMVMPKDQIEEVRPNEGEKRCC